jgi:hypothetical protein
MDSAAATDGSARRNSTFENVLVCGRLEAARIQTSWSAPLEDRGLSSGCRQPGCSVSDIQR